MAPGRLDVPYDCSCSTLVRLKAATMGPSKLSSA